MHMRATGMSAKQDEDVSDAQGALASWRCLGSRHRKEITRRGELLRGVAIFSKFTTAQLRKVAVAVQRLECTHGDRIFEKGQICDSMFIVDEGSCALLRPDNNGALPIDVESSVPKGAIFGDLSLLTGERHEATVVACSEPTSLLRLSAEVAQQLITDAIGGPDELQTRVDLLKRVEAFKGCTTGELLQLAAVSDKVKYEVGDTIVEQGKRGWHIYIVWQGNLTVHVENVGRVNELGAGEMFGEAALLNPVSYRSATVKADGPAVMLRLAQSDWRKVLKDERCLDLLSKTVVENCVRDKMRASPLIAASMHKFYDLAVQESARVEIEKAKRSIAPTHILWQRLRAKTKGTRVSRAAYTSLHVRIAKILDPDFDPDQAVLVAHREWADDLAAFAGKKAVHVWLEELRLTLREAAQAIVYQTGWSSIFEEADQDGSGELDVMEFIAAARNVMNVPPEALSDKDLQLLFTVADGSDDKAVSANEFSAFIAQTPHTVQLPDQMSSAMQANLRSTLTVLQSASHSTAVRRGWTKLFASYDRDGEGSLDLSEFSAVVREDCSIDKSVLPDEHLSDLFDAVDTDCDGSIDAFEFKNFLISDPLISEMTYEIFSEAMFQMAAYWSAEVQYDGELNDEGKYVAFLESLYEQVTVEQPALHLKEGKQRSLAPPETLKCAVDKEGKLKLESKLKCAVDEEGKLELESKLKPSRAGVAHLDHTLVRRTQGLEPHQDDTKSRRDNGSSENTFLSGETADAGVANPSIDTRPTSQWGAVRPEHDPKAKHRLQIERSTSGTIKSHPVDFTNVASKVFAQQHEGPMVQIEGLHRVDPNPNLIGLWRDSRLVPARTDVAAKPSTPRLPDWAAAPWKAMSPPKGCSKVMSPHPPRTKRKQAGRRKQGGAKWVVEDPKDGADVHKPERLHPATEQEIKASLTRAIAHRVTLYGHKVTNLESFHKAVDIDQSGGVNIEELRSAFKRLDPGFSNRQLDSLLITIDANDDGLVGFGELKAWMEEESDSVTPAGMQHGPDSELRAEPMAKELLHRAGSEPCTLPGISRHRNRAPIRPAAVKPSDWHSPRASLTKHMGFHPKTPSSRLPGGQHLRPVQTAAVDVLRAQGGIQRQQVLVASRVQQIRSRSPARLWEIDTAPERSRRIQIQRKIYDASKRRAMTQRLPRLGLHNDAAQESPLVAEPRPYCGKRSGVRHAEISAIVAGTGAHVPKTPLVLREPMSPRGPGQHWQSRPITVRTMCAALTDGE